MKRILDLMKEILPGVGYCDGLKTDFTIEYEQDGKIIATDGHRMLMIDKSVHQLKLAPRPSDMKKPPDMNFLLDGLIGTDFVMKVSYRWLRDKIMNHQFFYKAFKKRTCFKCYGKGEAECRCCGHETECDECDGDGILVNFEYMGHAAGSKDGYIKPSMIDLEANAAINYFYLPILERIMNVFPGAWYLHIDSTDHLKPVWFVSDSVIYMIATMRKW